MSADGNGSQVKQENEVFSSQPSSKLSNSGNVLYSDNQNFYQDQSESMNETFDSEDKYEFGFNYDEVQEYDVKEKLQSLNAQLASEPLPPEPQYRHSKVGFKDEMVSLMAPPDYYYPSESDLDDTSYIIDNPEFIPVNDKAAALSPTEQYMTPHTSPETSMNQVTKVDDNNISHEDDTRNNPDCTEYERMGTSETAMVVSRGGKFQFLSTDEITDGTKRTSRSSNDKLANGTKVREKNKKRPISAPATKRNRDLVINFDLGGSSHSDQNTRSSSTLDKPNDRLKYSIPHVNKDALSRQQERKKKKQEERLKQEEESQNMRKEENNRSFNAWLQIKQKQKKEEYERKKKEEDEEMERKEKQHEERKNMAIEIETELSKKMAFEKRKEEKLRQYKLKEIEDSMTFHTESERQKAFRDWLKRKHDEHQMKIREEKQNARITRLAMRQCRKSQNLAQAIQQSSSFPYFDFCEFP